jgi:hypothetical protein
LEILFRDLVIMEWYLIGLIAKPVSNNGGPAVPIMSDAVANKNTCFASEIQLIFVVWSKIRPVYTSKKE